MLSNSAMADLRDAEMTVENVGCKDGQRKHRRSFKNRTEQNIAKKAMK